jgi:hypothetical protein
MARGPCAASSIRSPTHQAFHDLVFNPKILDIVENLIGPDIQLHHTKLNLKPPSDRFEAGHDLRVGRTAFLKAA